MDINTLKEKIVRNIEIIKLLNKPTRYRLIFLLLIYPKLSLTELSKHLGKTKSTIIHHLKKFEKFNIFKTSRKPVPSYIDAKIYRLIPDFLKILKFNTTDFNQFSNPEKKNLLPSMLLKDIWVFELIRKMLEQSILLYKAIGETNFESETDTSTELIEFYLKNPIKYDIWTLTKEELESYEKLVEEFKIKLNNDIHETNVTKKNIERPYLVFHGFFPMNDLIKYDAETKKYIKFYKALD